jgi:uncharacterized membrane protein
MERTSVIEILPNFHPVLVHFTVALFSVATALFVGLPVAGKYLPENLRQQLEIVARWNLWLGAAATILTVAAGFHAYNTVAHDGPSHAAMTDHRNWAIATFVLFLSLAAWSILFVRAGKRLGIPFVALLLIAQLVLLSTGWRGGELVYRHGLGVLSLPAVEAGDDGHGHGHDDGDGHGHAPAVGVAADEVMAETMGGTESMPMDTASTSTTGEMHSDAPHGHEDDQRHAPAIGTEHSDAMESGTGHMEAAEHSDQPHGHDDDHSHDEPHG